MLSQVRKSRASALPPGMSPDVPKPVVKKEMTKAQKKNAARKAKRALDQKEKMASGESGIHLAQEMAKAKITAEDAPAKPVN